MTNKEKADFFKLLTTGKLADLICKSAKGKSLSNAGEVYHVVKAYMARDWYREQFVCLFLDAKNRIIKIETLFIGTLTATAVYPRDIVKRALELNAAAMILAHNHPSGDPQPSREDMNITQKIMQALHTVGISVHEHLVAGDNTYYSFADQGHIARYDSRTLEISGGY